MRHRSHVQLDEGEQAPSVVGDLDEDIWSNCPLPLTGPRGEWLAGVGLALEANQLHLIRQRRLQRHVDLTEASGMGKKERIWLTPLASSRWRPSGDDRLSLAGRPEVVRGRSPFAVWAATASEALSGKPGAAVAKRPRGRLGVDRGELGLGKHPVRGEEVEDAEIEIGERRGPRRGTRAGAASGSA